MSHDTTQKTGNSGSRTGFTRVSVMPGSSIVVGMPQTTVREFVKRFQADTAHYKSASYRSCEGTYARITCECLGDTLVRDIRPAHVRALLHQIAVVEGHPPNANRLRTFLSQLFKHAEVEEIRPVGSNPAAPLKPYKERPESTYLQPQQRLRFVESVHKVVASGGATPQAGFLFLIMLYAGLRWSDASWLRWDEVHLRERTIRLHPRGELRPKQKADGIEIPICEEAVRLIRSMPKISTVYVAPNPDTGKPYTQLKAARAKIYAEAGIRASGYHLLRHTTGTAAAEARLSLPEIAAVLGQRSIAATERYIHMAGKPAAAAASRMQAALLGDGEEGGDYGMRWTGFPEGEHGEGGRVGRHRRARQGQDDLGGEGDQSSDAPAGGARRWP